MKLRDRLKFAAGAVRGGEWWQDLVGKALVGVSGVHVSERTAANYSPVFACVSQASETVSTLPFGLYEKTAKGRIPREEHPVYKMLHDQTNPSMTAQTFRELMQWNCELRGIALASKIRNGYGQVVEMWPISPDKIIEYFTDPKTGKLFFKRDDGTILSQDDVFYFYGPGADGIVPKSRISYAKASLGVGIAAEEYGRRFFSEGTNLGGFLKHPGPKKLSDEAFKRLKTDIEQKYKGLQKSHGVIILEEGMEFQKVGLTNNDSQFLETRRFQVEEVCRWFNMKPHMIADLTHATYSNIEHQGIEGVRYSWRPRCVRWEQAVNTQLLAGTKLYAEHNLDGLMRGDLPSQATAWNTLIQGGVLNADEVRKFMNMNPQEGGQGKIYFMPMNMLDKAGTSVVSEPEDDGTSEPAPLPQEDKSFREARRLQAQRRSVDSRRNIAERYRPRLIKAAEKIVEKDIALLRKKLEETSQEDFKGWVNADYVNEFAETVRSEAAPVISAFATALIPAIEAEVGEVDVTRYDAFADSYIKKFSTRYGVRSRAKIRRVVDEEDYRDSIEALLEDWAGQRADHLQREELTRQRSAFTKAAYATAGIAKLRWVTNGKNCPFCDMLEGRVVGISEVFAESGSSLLPEGQAPMTFSSDVGHAPAHDGCDCDIVAEV